MAVTKIAPGETNIGWIGTGVMGSSMCGHLIDAGFRATVYTRTKSKAQPLLDKGAAWAESPRAVAEQSDVIFSIVGFPSDVRETFGHKVDRFRQCLIFNVGGNNYRIIAGPDYENAAIHVLHVLTADCDTSSYLTDDTFEAAH
jgi:mRNA-degrading endonuclease HigB of HigAB toxin-antitoxin module